MRNMKYKTLLEGDSIGQPSSQGALVFNQFLSMLLFFELLKTALVQVHHHLTYQSSTWKRFQSTIDTASRFACNSFLPHSFRTFDCSEGTMRFSTNLFPPSHFTALMGNRTCTRLGLAGSQRWTTMDCAGLLVI
jgi:hypothetical protein